MTEKRYYQGTGRRKTAVARVRLFPVAGEGRVVINGKSVEDYFGPRELFQRQIRMPFEVVGAGGYNVMVKVRGGGVAGQVGAVRHGISRALIDVNPDNRQPLKRTKVEDGNSLLTRDPRAKERKKVGLKRARKAPQYTKR